MAVAATGIGAGDMVAAAVAGATYGMAILWVALYGAVLKRLSDRSDPVSDTPGLHTKSLGCHLIVDADTMPLDGAIRRVDLAAGKDVQPSKVPGTRAFNHEHLEVIVAIPDQQQRSRGTRNPGIWNAFIPQTPTSRPSISI